MDVQPISIPQKLAYALDNAGSRSGVDFDYLLHTAMRESSLNPRARAATSTAVGLFQFLEGTWLQVVKEEGPALGYGRYAEMIERGPNGRYSVPDAAQKRELLALRQDPQMSADMAAAFTRSNGVFLQERFGRMPSPGELYIAHFLGASGAARLFEAGLNNPDQIAARLFPQQAEANTAIFYEGGAPRTIRQVYQALVAKHGVEVNSGFRVQQAQADAAAEGGEEIVPSRFGPENMSFTGLFRTEPETGVLPPLAPAKNAGNAAFFTQLYSR